MKKTKESCLKNGVLGIAVWCVIRSLHDGGAAQKDIDRILDLMNVHFPNIPEKDDDEICDELVNLIKSSKSS